MVCRDPSNQILDEKRGISKSQRQIVRRFLVERVLHELHPQKRSDSHANPAIRPRERLDQDSIVLEGETKANQMVKLRDMAEILLLIMSTIHSTFSPISWLRLIKISPYETEYGSGESVTNATTVDWMSL